ncbi:MAG TPA: hypothetical protein VFR24_05395 [Candidatus Angelobacter sp.]|nr:hypothetical protein [Candidatus Angelobacter sp.]
MFSLKRIYKDWNEAASLNAYVNLYGFWDEEAFLTKSGDLGLILRVKGSDYESMSHEQREYVIKRLEAAFKVFGPGVRVYQYLFKTNNPAIPFAAYPDPLIERATEKRKEFFNERRSRLFQVEIYYCVLLEGRFSQPTLSAALKQLPRDPIGALRELRGQFSSTATKVLLRHQIESQRSLLTQKVQGFVRQISDLVAIDILPATETFRVLKRLLNYEPWKIEAARPKATQFLDFQLSESNIEAERDHLRVGDHVVRVLTMKEAVAETRPLILKQLLEIPANFYAVTEWAPIEQAKARKEVIRRKRHFNNSKSSLFSALQDARTYNPRDVLVDESKQADIENLGDCLAALGDGRTMGEFSLTVVLYGRELKDLDAIVPEFARVFSSNDGVLHPETYNQINAYFATVPGNYHFNLRRVLLLNSNYADLSFLFTSETGEKINRHLNAEYLAVLETENATPYFLNLHERDVAHTLILGPTGSGKSFLLNFLIQNMQKYRPLTYIFDLGRSFEGITRIFDGTYLNVGMEDRDFTINPFSLPPTKDNLQFLYMFFKVLLEGERYQALGFEEERKLYAAIERVYVLDESQRTLTNFADIVGPLKDRLHRWTCAGQYGHIFDRERDTLTFSRFQCFNFDRMEDSPEILEPLLFYILHRASNEIADPRQVATFKAFMVDEARVFVRNKIIRDYINMAQKTWRKLNAAMILATQSVRDLSDADMLTLVAESCPTKIFLANPDMDGPLYKDAFQLNDTELEIIAGLQPPGQMLVSKPKGAKKVLLNVDTFSYWMSTNNAQDNALKWEYFARYGIQEGLERLARERPQPSVPEKRAA